MQALVIPQPFKLHTRFIAIFDDLFTPEMIRIWIIGNLAHFELNKPEVIVVKSEHWADKLEKLVTYNIVHAEGFIRLHLITLKLNEICEIQ